MEGVVSEAVLLTHTLADEVVGLGARARIIDGSGAQVGAAITLTPSPAIGWHFTGAWTPAAPGQFSAVVETFTDGSFVTRTDHEPGQTEIRVWAQNQDAMWVRLLGHHGENVRDTVLAADANGRPLSARRRVYASKADAAADVNHVAELTVTAAYSGTPWDSLLRVLEP